MLEPLRQMFRGRRAAPAHAVPDGERYYVVGDIHGRLDLFSALVEAMEADDAASAEARTTIVLLGDLVDRGPDSAGVIALARRLHERREVRLLAGNHEEMFLESFEDAEVLRHFLRHGGRETILSYGIDRLEYNNAELHDLQEIMRAAVPREDREFLESFDEYMIAGDYLFVHAGIDPAVPLEDQKRRDMLWIRERFLRHGAAHSHMIVHGHSISEDVDERSNRIGLDTGAFRTGRLTAVVLEGTSRRYIQAVENDGDIRIESRSSR
ncbi:metallophosphoesterase family protein [Pseudopontixanthobacter vadosimaris]|uniref:metallophosphoesterase family protein n=1 Tax=Pseudopontixanthobacter vadosimaris TaxID=2726450 RepID=UPI001475F6B8|nr:metallophosphoesterase family protein [Pseudopontixanthobacter vadosimaris]